MNVSQFEQNQSSSAPSGVAGRLIAGVTASILAHGRFQITEPSFYSGALEQGLTAFAADDWLTEATDPQPVMTIGSLIMSSRIGRAHKAVLKAEEGLLLVGLAQGQANVTAAASSPDRAASLLERAKVALPRPAPKEEQKAAIAFQGAEFMASRLLEVPRWEEIQGNYPPAVAEQLGQLITRGSNQPGRLLLWQGPPGTGKTYALRALAWEWREWCDVHYITDPEVFFGPRSNYMLEMLMDGPRNDEGDRWKLLIAEDTGELIAKDAKSQSGQGLSRLLNMVDGLIGQGFKTMVVITSNEEISAMNEAVVRPGRAGSVLEFEPFTVDEANQWLRARGKEPLADRKPRTLAELYAGVAPQRASIGFANGAGTRKRAA